MSIVDASKLHEQLTQAMNYLRQADTGDCQVSVNMNHRHMTHD
jgi:hypothetical protein